MRVADFLFAAAAVVTCGCCCLRLRRLRRSAAFAVFRGVPAFGGSVCGGLPGLGGAVGVAVGVCAAGAGALPAARCGSACRSVWLRSWVRAELVLSSAVVSCGKWDMAASGAPGGGSSFSLPPSSASVPLRAVGGGGTLPPLARFGDRAGQQAGVLPAPASSAPASGRIPSRGPVAPVPPPLLPHGAFQAPATVPLFDGGGVSAPGALPTVPSPSAQGGGVRLPQVGGGVAPNGAASLRGCGVFHPAHSAGH